MSPPSSDAPPLSPPVLPSGVPMIRTIAMPSDTNPAGDIFGGWLMAQMDLAAGNAAARRARGRCVTIAVDGMAFLSPVHVGDEVSLYARILSVGRTSMKILVEAWRRPRHAFESIQVTKATFTFVAIDENGRPRPVPEDQPPPENQDCENA
ncbi:acyl-CoA thioesterase [Aliidongia dinghuensis]|uniref:Acyl-CoA thioesterase n=1 Tax=Aliidongia dinghuensis TaxID=1867774 RepID=A0A8J3E119_9PROT|nr:acyl-CoA thioesterase [Aliidongia dinghuensis]GGF07044.1 acyl-CoA thioesterase [Aliidongia dinghuensis]